MNVLFREALQPIEVEFQRAYDAAIVIDRHGAQRFDVPLAAQLRIEQEFRVYIRRTQHLASSHASSANGGRQWNLASQGQGRGSRSGPVTDGFSIKDADRRATGVCNSRDSLRDYRHRLVGFQMANLNLVLRFHNLGQSQRV